MISWCRCSWPCTQGVGPLDPVDPVSDATSVHAGVQVAIPTQSNSNIVEVDKIKNDISESRHGNNEKLRG